MAVRTEKGRVNAMERTIDARGMTCPKPVILAKKAMDESKKGDVLQVLVDNEIAVTNLRKLAPSQEAEYSFTQSGEKQYEVQMIITKEGNTENEAMPELEACEMPEKKRQALS